jgi:hypothetical protein
LAAYVDEWAYTCRDAGAKSVRGQGLRLLEKTTAQDFEKRYAEPWRSKKRKEREQLVLQVLEYVHRGRATGPEMAERMRVLAPEITLEQLAGGGGEGLLKLANSLVVEGWTQNGQWSVFVRHEAFERKFLFNFDQDTLLPSSRALRCFQEEQRLTRHSHLFEVVLDLLAAIVSLVRVNLHVNRAEPSPSRMVRSSSTERSLATTRASIRRATTRPRWPAKVGCPTSDTTSMSLRLVPNAPRPVSSHGSLLVQPLALTQFGA